MSRATTEQYQNRAEKSKKNNKTSLEECIVKLTLHGNEDLDRGPGSIAVAFGYVAGQVVHRNLSVTLATDDFPLRIPGAAPRSMLGGLE
jgi:hypothetical protein